MLLKKNHIEELKVVKHFSHKGSFLHLIPSRAETQCCQVFAAGHGHPFMHLADAFNQSDLRYTVYIQS